MSSNEIETMEELKKMSFKKYKPTGEITLIHLNDVFYFAEYMWGLVIKLKAENAKMRKGLDFASYNGKYIGTFSCKIDALKKIRKNSKKILAKIDNQKESKWEVKRQSKH